MKSKVSFSAGVALTDRIACTFDILKASIRKNYTAFFSVFELSGVCESENSEEIAIFSHPEC